MGSCIICGAPVDGSICSSHEEDVVFEFRGSSPNQLVPRRYYHGTVDGYAEFGVFVDLAPGVTGLLHRSELDRRLESLDWEPGDTVFVQVKNVRDNGNVDLGWSIRQDEAEFRGALVQDGTTDVIPDESGDEDAVDAESADEQQEAPAGAHGAEPEPVEGDAEPTPESADAEAQTHAGEAAPAGEDDATRQAETSTETDDEGRPGAEYERVPVSELSEHVGSLVRLEGEVVGARQTGGPTVFELRDETGVVDCAAFVEAGVRAYPEIEVGDVVRLEGEIELRGDDIQVETDALAALDGEEAEAVTRRLENALTEKARPDEVTPLAPHRPVEAATERIRDAAEAVRRAVLESRPIVVRHPATADGYVAGAAIERAVLPLIRDEHAQSDAVYHYFTRRPLEDGVYDMDAATKDVTLMLEDRDRHDEKLPLVLLVGVGSTTESLDGLELLAVYGVSRVVVDAAISDPEIEDEVDVLVDPSLAGADASDLSTGALVSTLAATVNESVREDLSHLPAVSYWEGVPEAYVELAKDAGFDEERVTELREAIALEAFYQSYQDKRELVADLLFDDAGRLAHHVSEQFRTKLDDEIETAEANLDIDDVGGVRFAILDMDAFTHRFDFPPKTLLLDALHRRKREGDRFVTLGLGMDELYLRSTVDLDVRQIAARAAETVPEAGVTANGVRNGRIEFLAGLRDDVTDAVVAAVVEQFE